MGPYNSTNAELIWIVDSNITVLRDCLSNAVALMDDPRVGLVHHVPVAVELGTLGAFLDGAFLSCSHFRLYTFINSVKVASCIIGKSTMFRKQDLDQFGGISTYAKFLSEDNAIGVDLWNMNRRHVVGQDLAYQSIGNVSLHDFFERRIRWIRVRKHSLKGVVLATYYEPFTECLVSSIVGSLSFNYFFGVNISSFVTIHWVCWFLVDMIIASVAYRQAFAQKLSKWFPIYFAGSWLLREVIALPAYLWAMNGNTIVWRGHVYILNSNGTITAKKPKSEK